MGEKPLKYALQCLYRWVWWKVHTVMKLNRQKNDINSLRFVFLKHVCPPHSKVLSSIRRSPKRWGEPTHCRGRCARLRRWWCCCAPGSPRSGTYGGWGWLTPDWWRRRRWPASGRKRCPQWGCPPEGPSHGCSRTGRSPPVLPRGGSR